MPPKPAMPAEMPHHHPNVVLISIISILIGLIAGAAGAFYGKDYIMTLIPGAAPAPQETQTMVDQATQEQQAAQAQAGATAEAYTSVDTNPLGDVQTNPF